MAKEIHIDEMRKDVKDLLGLKQGVKDLTDKIDEHKMDLDVVQDDIKDLKKRDQ